MSEKFQNITQASDWEDWKKTCAYLNCSSESQSRLGVFGVSRMLNWLESVKGMKGILEGKYDELPEQAFYMVGGIDEVTAKAEKLAAEAATN